MNLEAQPALYPEMKLPENVWSYTSCPLYLDNLALEDKIFCLYDGKNI
jgi:hypothetical protein